MSKEHNRIRDSFELGKLKIYMKIDNNIQNENDFGVFQ